MALTIYSATANTVTWATDFNEYTTTGRCLIEGRLGFTREYGRTILCGQWLDETDLTAMVTAMNERRGQCSG